MTLLRFFWNQPVTVPPPQGGDGHGGGMDTGGGEGTTFWMRADDSWCLLLPLPTICCSFPNKMQQLKCTRSMADSTKIWQFVPSNSLFLHKVHTVLGVTCRHKKDQKSEAKELHTLGIEPGTLDIRV